MPVYSAKRVVKEGFFFLSFISAFSILSGQVLHVEESTLLVSSYLLFIIPPFIDVIGDLASVFSARLTSALRIGALKTKDEKSSFLAENFFIVTISGFILLILIAFSVELMSWILRMKELEIWRSILVIEVAGFICLLLLIVVATVVSLGTYRYGLDPDNFASPLISTIADLVGTILILYIWRMITI